MLVSHNIGPVTEREVSILEGEALAGNYGWKFVEICSQDPTSIDMAFHDVVRLIRTQRILAAKRRQSTQNGPQAGQTLVILGIFPGSCIWHRCGCRPSALQADDPQRKVSTTSCNFPCVEKSHTRAKKWWQSFILLWSITSNPEWKPCVVISGPLGTVLNETHRHSHGNGMKVVLIRHQIVKLSSALYSFLGYHIVNLYTKYKVPGVPSTPHLHEMISFSPLKLQTTNSTECNYPASPNHTKI